MADHILTEGSDIITTEGGDRLITETSAAVVYYTAQAQLRNDPVSLQVISVGVKRGSTI